MTDRSLYTIRDFWGEGGFENLCRKYLTASLLYYRYDISPVPDEEFDNWTKTLYLSYKKTPTWFQKRVSLDDLRAGTGFTVKPTEKEETLCEEFIVGERNIQDYF